MRTKWTREIAIFCVVGILVLGLISSCDGGGGGGTTPNAKPTRTSMPTLRGHLAIGVVNNKIYAIGGVGGFSKYLPTVEEYNPSTDKWTKKADMPTARNGLAVGVVNNKIYVIGGLGDGGYISTVEEYDPSTDKWTKKAGMPTAKEWTCCRRCK